MCILVINCKCDYRKKVKKSFTQWWRVWTTRGTLCTWLSDASVYFGGVKTISTQKKLNHLLLKCWKTNDTKRNYGQRSSSSPALEFHLLPIFKSHIARSFRLFKIKLHVRFLFSRKFASFSPQRCLLEILLFSDWLRVFFGAKDDLLLHRPPWMIKRKMEDLGCRIKMFWMAI